MKLTTSVSYESTRLVDEINSLKNEQNTLSPVDDFAKHSKLERKIIKLRQDLESFNQDTSVSRVQAKAAFATIWKTIGGMCTRVSTILEILEILKGESISLKFWLKIFGKLVSDLL